MNQHSDSGKAAPGNRFIPDWARTPFHYFTRRIDTLHHLLRLSMRGIAMLRGMPRLTTALANLDKQFGPHPDAPARSPDDAARYLQEIEQEAALATQEVDTGFPLLHEQAVVSLWGWTEAALENLVAAWLLNRTSARAVPAIANLRIRLGEYEPLDDENGPFISLIFSSESRARHSDRG